jgi:hypothetical protein
MTDKQQLRSSPADIMKQSSKNNQTAVKRSQTAGIINQAAVKWQSLYSIMHHLHRGATTLR